LIHDVRTYRRAQLEGHGTTGEKIKIKDKNKGLAKQSKESARHD
jgi:hypothetical protein